MVCTTSVSRPLFRGFLGGLLCSLIWAFCGSSVVQAQHRNVRPPQPRGSAQPSTVQPRPLTSFSRRPLSSVGGLSQRNGRGMSSLGTRRPLSPMSGRPLAPAGGLRTEQSSSVSARPMGSFGNRPFQPVGGLSSQPGPIRVDQGSAGSPALFGPAVEHLPAGWQSQELHASPEASRRLGPVRVPAAASDGGARLRSPPSPASLFLAEGQFSLQHGRYDLAERLLEQGAAAAARPGEAELFCGLAAFARGRYERAAEHWIASCERDPRLFCRGPSLRAALPSNEELLSRSQDLRRHLSWQPGDPQALFVAARVELEVGDLRGSLRWVQSLRQVAPEHPFLRLLEEELASRLRSK